MQHTYSVASDTLNSKVDLDALEKQVRAASGITKALDYCSLSGDVLKINFKATLIASEITALDAVVAAHDGVALVEVSKVQSETVGIPSPNGLRARLAGTHFGTAVKNTVTDFDWQIPQLSWLGVNKQSYFNGIEYFAKNALPHDKLTFQVVDKDGLIYPAGTLLEEFGTDWPVMPDAPTDIILYKAKLIPGMYIRVKYNTTSTDTDVIFSCGIYRHLAVNENV